MIKIYGIKNCDSVKKAISFFKSHNLEHTLHDFKQESVPKETISSWLEKTDMKTIFNARSTTYKNLKLKELDLDDNDKLEWLAKENLLIKRPIIEYNTEVIVGFNENNYKEVFL